MRRFVKLIDTAYQKEGFYLYEDLDNGCFRHVGNYWGRTGWASSISRPIENLDQYAKPRYIKKVMSETEANDLLIDAL